MPPPEEVMHGKSPGPLISGFSLSPDGHGPDVLQPAGPLGDRRAAHGPSSAYRRAPDLFTKAELVPAVHQGLRDAGPQLSRAAPHLHEVSLAPLLRTSA